MSMSDTAEYAVAIVVDPEFGNRLLDVADRSPVWVADTEGNRAAAAIPRPRGSGSHTAVGAVTTFTVDPAASLESWCIDVLGDIDLHHGPYSHTPGYSAVEICGVEPSPALLAALAEYRLTTISRIAGGFRASTPDGEPAGLPEDQ